MRLAVSTDTYHSQGFWVGPHLSNGLKTYFGAANVASEGVDYLGLIDTNFFQGGAPPVGIGLMQILLTRAATLCPTAKIVAAGYR
jgi:cutinase